MNPLRALGLALALLTGAAGPAAAQTPLSTAGFGLYSLGDDPSQGSWGLRGNYSTGLKWAGAERPPPESLGLLPDYSRSGVYADWFPYGRGFRLVGGLNFGDVRGTPGGTSGLVLQSSAWRAKSPYTTPYLGVGYGQLSPNSLGLGFYADMGVMLGTLASDPDNGSGNGATAAASLDGWRAQSNGWLGFRYLPSVSLGLIYRY